MLALVTVIVPCFNYARYLDACIESLKRQSYNAWECVIVDDGSSDETASVCRRLAASDSRIRCLHFEQNRGPSAARNAGIELTRGDYVQFLDADDILEPDKLRAQVAFLESRPCIDIVVGKAAYFLADCPQAIEPWQPKGTSDMPGEPNGDTVLSALVGENICMMHAVLLRRRVFNIAGVFDEQLRMHEDWDYWLRCALKNLRFGFVSRGQDRALVRKHRFNTSRARMSMLRSAAEVRNRFSALLPEPLARTNAMLLDDINWRLGIEMVVEGRMAEGWQMYVRTVSRMRNKAPALLRVPLLVPGVARALRTIREWRSSDLKRSRG